uniref:Gag-pol protein n=1 Tax=Solanum tuberosum TaxID=4113 RepID=M1DTV3_SOLTU
MKLLGKEEGGRGRSRIDRFPIFSSAALIIMPPHRAYGKNGSARNTNTAPPVPDQEVSNAKFWNAFQLLTQSVTNQNNQQVPIPANASSGSVAARVRDIVRMNQTEFLGSQIGEDSQNFIDKVKKIFGLQYYIKYFVLYMNTITFGEKYLICLSFYLIFVDL